MIRRWSRRRKPFADERTPVAALGTLVAKCGMAFNGAAPSTLGALFAIAAMRASKEARGAEQVDTALLARMARAAELGIMERGKAERGDKTLLDALGPSASRAGVQATIELKAKSGRAAWIPERTLGQPDPGATVILRMWEAFSDYLRETGGTEGN